jgi:lysylphosphatidylglycerol synthetase-like protein (DUF2156 family)
LIIVNDNPALVVGHGSSKARKEVAVNFLTLVVLVATLATIAALALGISSMVRDGEIAHFDSEHWMASRVVLQATVVLALVAAFFVGT